MNPVKKSFWQRNKDTLKVSIIVAAVTVVLGGGGFGIFGTACSRMMLPTVTAKKVSIIEEILQGKADKAEIKALENNTVQKDEFNNLVLMFRDKMRSDSIYQARDKEFKRMVLRYMYDGKKPKPEDLVNF